MSCTTRAQVWIVTVERDDQSEIIEERFLASDLDAAVTIAKEFFAEELGRGLKIASVNHADTLVLYKD